jgi:quercetin dioxygenase-like cupin family protein
MQGANVKPHNSLNIRALLTLICSSMIAAAAAGHADTPSLPDPLKAGWQGKPVCEHLYEDIDKRILRCTFPPGSGHERHFHAPHFGYCVAGGQVRITSEDGIRELDLPTGSSYTSEGVPWHEVVNTGSTTIIYLLVERKEGP